MQDRLIEQLQKDLYISDSTIETYLERFEDFSAPALHNGSIIPPYWAPDRTSIEQVTLFRKREWGDSHAQPEFSIAIKTIISFLLKGFLELIKSHKDLTAFDLGIILFDPELQKIDPSGNRRILTILNRTELVKDILGGVFSVTSRTSEGDSARVMPIGQIDESWMLDFWETAFQVRTKLQRLAGLDPTDAEDQETERKIQTWIDSARAKKITWNAFATDGEGNDNQSGLPAFISIQE